MKESVGLSLVMKIKSTFPAFLLDCPIINYAQITMSYIASCLKPVILGFQDISLWTLGNLAASDIKVWHIIRSQAVLPALLHTLEIPDVMENSTYTLLHYVRTGLYELE